MQDTFYKDFLYISFVRPQLNAHFLPILQGGQGDGPYAPPWFSLWKTCEIWLSFANILLN